MKHLYKIKSKTENVSNKYANAYEIHKTKWRHTNSIERWQRQGRCLTIGWILNLEKHIKTC